MSSADSFRLKRIAFVGGGDYRVSVTAPKRQTEIYWREIAEELSRQNLELQVRVRELEAALAERASK